MMLAARSVTSVLIAQRVLLVEIVPKAPVQVPREVCTDAISGEHVLGEAGTPHGSHRREGEVSVSDQRRHPGHPILGGHRTLPCLELLVAAQGECERRFVGSSGHRGGRFSRKSSAGSQCRRRRASANATSGRGCHASTCPHRLPSRRSLGTCFADALAHGVP